MKKIIVALVAVAALLSTSTASADKSFSPGCGSASPGLDSGSAVLTYHSGWNWEVQYSANCSMGGTTEWEVQISKDGGSHYNDINENGGGTIDHLAGAPTGGDSNYDKLAGANGCFNAPGDLYRAKIWDSNSSIVSSTHVPTCN